MLDGMPKWRVLQQLSRIACALLLDRRHNIVVNRHLKVQHYSAITAEHICLMLVTATMQYGV